MQVWPLGFYLWVLYLAKALGRAYSSSSVLVQITQFVFVGAWPFFFVYTIGPMFTAITVMFPRFMLWLLSLFTRRVSPTAALAEVKEFCEAFPADAAGWWGQYFYEIRRDLTVLGQCFADLGAVISQLPSVVVFCRIPCHKVAAFEPLSAKRRGSEDVREARVTAEVGDRRLWLCCL